MSSEPVPEQRPELPPSAGKAPTPTLRVRRHRDLNTLLAKLQPGDLAVIERPDLDAATARALLERRPTAVLNVAAFITGRFANLGPRELADAGVRLWEADADDVAGLRDGKEIRFSDGTLYDGPVVLCDVRVLDAATISTAMEQASAGLAAQLDSFAHTASEFLRREQGLLLNGIGMPTVSAKLRGRPVVVLGPQTNRSDLKKLKRFFREQKPATIAVDQAADQVKRLRRRARPDVLMLTGSAAVGDKSLARAREVVLLGGTEPIRRRLEKRNLLVHEVDTSVSAGDLGLLIAHFAGARLILPAGFPASLEEFVDTERSDQASNVLTRLKVGSRLVEASAVPLLYTGRVRGVHLGGTLLACLGVLAATLAATPIGQGWAHDLLHHLPASWGIDR